MRLRSLLYSSVLLLFCNQGLQYSAFGALWQSREWAITAVSHTDIGFDSNVTQSTNGESAAYVGADPTFSLVKLGSSSALNFTAMLAPKIFFGDFNDTQLDASTKIQYAYPEGSVRLARRTFETGWERTTESYPAIGERITSNAFSLQAGTRFGFTGKLGLVSNISLNRSKHVGSTSNTNDRGDILIGIGYEPNPLYEFSVVALAARSLSKPQVNQGRSAQASELSLLARAEGEFSARLSGQLSAGAKGIRYSGTTSGDDLLPFVRGEATWKIGPRSQIIAGAQSDANFSVRGEAQETQAASLTLQQTVYKAWSASIISRYQHYAFNKSAKSQEGNIVTGGFTVAYVPSDRFDASFLATFSHAESDRTNLTFERTLISLKTTYHF